VNISSPSLCPVIIVVFLACIFFATSSKDDGSASH